jgi:hypothetical protein
MRTFLIVATSLVSLLAQSAQRVTSVRLYVFDCGVLVRGEPTAYGLTKEQVGDTNFADACYLVAHPKGYAPLGRRHHPRRPNYAGWSKHCSRDERQQQSSDQDPAKSTR